MQLLYNDTYSLHSLGEDEHNSSELLIPGLLNHVHQRVDMSSAYV